MGCSTEIVRSLQFGENHQTGKSLFLAVLVFARLAEEGGRNNNRVHKGFRDGWRLSVAVGPVLDGKAVIRPKSCSKSRPGALRGWVLWQRSQG